MTTDEVRERCAQQKIAILINACDIASKHYDDYYKGFAAIDGKAQGIATISGLVLAAIAAFLKDGRVPVLARRGPWWTILILAVPIFALAAVLVSLWGQRVTDVVEPFDAPSRISEAEDLAQLSCDQFGSEHVANYYRAQLQHWRDCLDGTARTIGIKDSVEKKAQHVLWGQRLMMAALVLLTVLFGVILFVSH